MPIRRLKKIYQVGRLCFGGKMIIILCLELEKLLHEYKEILHIKENIFSDEKVEHFHDEMLQWIKGIPCICIWYFYA